MRRVVLASLITLGAVVLVASPAQAHNYIVSSSPAADSTIAQLPAEYSVTTNGPLLVLDGNTAAFAMQVVGPDGLYYGDGCITVLGPTMSMPATIGDAGVYTLRWQLVSEDGHPVSGEFAFTWAPDAAAEPSRGSAAPPVCGATTPNPSTAPSATGQPTATAEPVATPEARPDASLWDVLWIGGAVVAVLAAGMVALLVVTRRRKN